MIYQQEREEEKVLTGIVECLCSSLSPPPPPPHQNWQYGCKQVRWNVVECYYMRGWKYAEDMVSIGQFYKLTQTIW